VIHLFADEDNYLFAEEMTDSLHTSGMPTELHPVGYTIPALPAGEIIHFIGSYYLDWILDALSSYGENPVIWSPSISNYNYKADATIDFLGTGFATMQEWRQSEIHKIGQVLSKVSYLCCFSSQELGFLHGLGGIPTPVQPCFVYTPLMDSYLCLPSPPMERIVFYDNGRVENGLDLLLRKNGILDLLQTEAIEFLLVRRTREFWDDHDGLYREKLFEELEQAQRRHNIAVSSVKTEKEVLDLLTTGKVFVDLHSWVSNPSFHLVCFSWNRDLVATMHGCLVEYLGSEVHYTSPSHRHLIATSLTQAWSKPHYHNQDLSILDATKQLQQQQLAVWQGFYRSVQQEQEADYGPQSYDQDNSRQGNSGVTDTPQKDFYSFPPG
jgi:hypothetical protein